MPLLDLTRVVDNLLVLAILFIIGFMIYTKMGSEKAKGTMERLKGLFRGKKE